MIYDSFFNVYLCNKVPSNNCSSIFPYFEEGMYVLVEKLGGGEG